MAEETARLRGEAERLRTLAQKASDGPTIDSLNDLAQEYEAEAQNRAEEIARAQLNPMPPAR